MTVKDKHKTLARKLQQQLVGWSYQSCRNLLEKHGWDYNAAVSEERARIARNRKDPA